jgi:hypothetical protein
MGLTLRKNYSCGHRDACCRSIPVTVSDKTCKGQQTQKMDDTAELLRQERQNASFDVNEFADLFDESAEFTKAKVSIFARGLIANSVTWRYS